MSYKYRKDIDGLRALAVIPVVLFHSSYEFFSGGYVGVDIFFVISGFLITNILIKSLSEDKFSITTFYESRIRRIFPALFVVLAVCVFLSIWLMLPGEFKKFKHSLLSTLFFYTNYFFMFDTGYFANAAETKPLLHIWSLAVEEQFYVFFPVYLFLAFKYCKKHIGVLTVGLFLLSFTYSELLVRSLPSDAFYSTPARAWELLIGSLLAIYPQRKFLKHKFLSNTLSLIGLCLIVYAVVFFNKVTPFPGSMALFPVLGSALILLSANSEGNIVGRLLSSPVFRFFGLISYSLYLWHWPVLTYARIYSLGSDPHELMPYLLCIIVLLAYLSWKYIEAPFRKGALLTHSSKWKVNRLSIMLILLFVSITALALSNYVRKPQKVYTAHIEKRSKGEAYKLKECESYKASMIRIRICYFGDLNAETASFALLGDSHGRALLPGIFEVAKKSNKKGIYIGSGGCISLFGAGRAEKGRAMCETRMDAFAEYIAEHPEVSHIFLASRWGAYTTGVRYKDRLGSNFYIVDEKSEEVSINENRKVFERSFRKTVEFLNKLDKKVIVITQVPETEYGGRDIVRAKFLKKEVDFRPTLLDYLARQKIAFDVFDEFVKKGEIELIKLHEYMCGDKHCDVFNEKGKYIYKNDNHITEKFALELSPLYNYIFEQF